MKTFSDEEIVEIFETVEENEKKPEAYEIYPSNNYY